MSKGKIALVTGANRGIGKEIVRQLAAKGFRVVLTARDLKAGGQAASTIAGDVGFLELDVADDPSISQAAENDSSHTSGAYVTFEPGARSAWHTHPLGQTLIVPAGTGWIQQAGGQKQEINPGDVIWIPPGVKRWHGATATTAMTHIAIQGQWITA
jgi:quercetin dioxygenase-like cupin family protein